MKAEGRMKNLPRWLKVVILVVLSLALALALTLTIIFKWETYKDVFGDSLTLALLAQIVIFITLLCFFPKFRKWIRDTTGEKPPIQKQRRWYQFIFPTLFAIPFVLYVLLAGINESLSPVIEFSLLAVAPTLGGLVLTAAGNRRPGSRAHIELTSVAQKLILATVLLIAFAALFFTANLAESADIEFLYWASFWGSVWTFYPGVFLFLLGISDLVFALRHLRR
jgi:uncharacterized membrane protein